MVIAAESLLAWATFALALATVGLAVFAALQWREARQQREATTESLRVARATLLAEQRPELIAASEHRGPERDVHLLSYGSTKKHFGDVMVSAQIENGQVGLVSFEARNIGRGSAAITRLRVMSLDTLPEGGGPMYWQPDPSVRVRIIVPPDGIAPVDLVMTTDMPGWFRRTVDGHLKLWVEVSYEDVAAVQAHRRWFEFRERLGTTGSWYVAQVLDHEPQPFKNVPDDVGESIGVG